MTTMPDQYLLRTCRNTKRAVLLAVLSVFAFAGANTASAQPIGASPAPLVSDDLPGDNPSIDWLEETFTNVKQVNIVVCSDSAGPVPDWLATEALTKDALDYIARNHHVITYADGKTHEPHLMGPNECKYGPYLDDPGNLNFIINVIVNRIPIGGHEVSVAAMSRVIYRPDHRTSIFGFLWAHPLVFDLTDQEKAKQYYDRYKNLWVLGNSDDQKYYK
jgi:hypothetical protein